MARHSTQTRLDALASYAISGNASDAARKHNVAGRTMRQWVRKALSGEDHQGKEILDDAGDELRSHAIDAAMRMALGVIEESSTRFHEEAEAPAEAENGRFVMRPDQRHQYGKIVLDGAKMFVTAHHKLETLDRADVVLEEEGDIAARANELVRRSFGAVTPDVEPDEGSEDAA